MEKDRLEDICHINSNYGDDTFVGIKSKNDNIEVRFPMGYVLGENDNMVRKDILLLLHILSEFTSRTESELNRDSKKNKEVFPILSYLFIIKDYLNNGYYTETEIRYHTSKRGKINWNRTIKTQKPFPTDDGFYYLDFVVRQNSVNQNELITLVHEACVYLCFQKLGWIYTSAMPNKTRLKYNPKMFISVIMESLCQTFNDKKKELFNHMLKVIKAAGDEETLHNFTYGTNKYEYVWEGMIDYVFGIDHKEKYFPKTNWHLLEKEKENSALEPDTIMINKGNAYVLDAKYYKYGITAIPSELPNSSSINKQITYAEYIYKNKLTDDMGNILKPYNAFIMPFSKDGKYFRTDKNYKFIGFADTEWKIYQHDYEHVQGILIDINYLMKNCVHKSIRDIEELSELILEVVQEQNK